MVVKRSYEEINEKLKKGTAVVLTAEEVSKMAGEMTPSEIAKKVDVVTTATFGPMCSSGAFINFGHPSPSLRMEEVTLNGVPAYGGIAAVDAYIGATSEHPQNPRYGGGHIIEELVQGKEITLKARGKGTDCYPRKEIETVITKDAVNEIFLFNPRNAYQNYAVATNTAKAVKYTYMGVLLPELANATYSTSGELSPLLNDPDLRTIGVGTRIFLCGAPGFVVWPGTQFNTSKLRNDKGIPKSNAATLAVLGDLKKMDPRFIKGAVFERYGVTLFVGIGVPIPILDEGLAARCAVRNREIETTVYDYGDPAHPMLGSANYADLQSGTIEVRGRKVKTAPLSSIKKAREIAEELRSWLKKGEFALTAPVEMFPTGTTVKGLEIKGGAK